MARILVITGPTASGKSGLAMDLAEKYSLEIISADSMQVYRHMDIGTDKASQEDQKRVPHHLIDVKDPDEPWSVEEFQRGAAKAIENISRRDNIPCVVGGTGFYIRALLHSFPLQQAPPNLSLRLELNAIATSKGKEAVHGLLKYIDPESYQDLHPNDLKRVSRAIEYYHATQEPISARKHLPKQKVHDYLMMGLRWPRQELYRRINDRVDEQFERGLVEEVLRLLRMGYSGSLTSMQGIGYKEIYWMLHGLATESETRDILKRNTRRFAKRQFTWFTKEEGIIWLPAGKYTSRTDVLNKAQNLIDKWLLKCT